MEIIFLGTSSGTPTRTRNVSSVAIKRTNTKSWFMVDCGEGTQHQILRTNLALNNLSAIFITHVHGDHSYGLPGLLASAGMTGRKDPLLIVGPEPIGSFIDAFCDYSQLKLSYELTFQSIDNLPVQSVENPHFSIETVELSHRVPSYAYAFIEKEVQSKLNVEKLKQMGIKSGPVWGRLQRGEDIDIEDGRCLKSRDFLLEPRPPRKIIVAGDNDKPSLLKKSSVFSSTGCAASVLIHESTYTQDILDKVGDEPKHASAKAIAQFATAVSLRNLILTHFSPRYQDDIEESPSIRDIEDEAQRYYQGNLFLANDFDMFHLNRDSTLSRVSSAET